LPQEYQLNFERPFDQIRHSVNFVEFDKIDSLEFDFVAGV